MIAMQIAMKLIAMIKLNQTLNSHFREMNMNNLLPSHCKYFSTQIYYLQNYTRLNISSLGVHEGVG
jgi:hypothetical protein